MTDTDILPGYREKMQLLSDTLLSVDNDRKCGHELFGDHLNPYKLEQPLVNRRINTDLIGDSNGGYYLPAEKMFNEFQKLYNDQLFSCQAADLIVKLDLERYTAWRRIFVPMHYTFEQLHDVLQVVFGWRNEHLYEFDLNTSGNEAIRLVMSSDELAEFWDINRTRYLVHDKTLTELLTESSDFTYTYDLGDSWIHHIHVNGIVSEFHRFHPICLMGEGNPPPDNVGGVDGYLQFLDSMSNPTHPDHEYTKNWMSAQWHPDFDVNRINLQLEIT